MLSTLLDDFIDRRGKVRDQAEAALVAADPADVIREGLPRLATTKGSKGERLFDLLKGRREALDDVRVLAPWLREVWPLPSRRSTFWQWEAPKVLDGVGAEPALCAFLIEQLDAPEGGKTKIGSTLREGVASLLGSSGHPAALRALVRRARADRHRAGFFDAATEAAFDELHPPAVKPPKPAPWREAVNYSIVQFHDERALPTLILELAARSIANGANLWPELEARVGDLAPWRARQDDEVDPIVLTDEERTRYEAEEQAFIDGEG